MTLSDKNILIDPGPGTLVKCTTSKPKLDPSRLDAIILTHKHLDHSADINIMIEAMTNGGFKKRGCLFAPEDALTEDPVVLNYLRGFVEKIEILKEGGAYSLGDIRFNTPKRHIHGVETYGLNIKAPGRVSLSFIVDTRYFKGLETYYDGEIIILNVVRHKPGGKEDVDIDHLNASDAERIIDYIKPKLAIITHFGMTMLRARPWEVAAQIQERTGVKVIAARDGMGVNIDEVMS